MIFIISDQKVKSLNTNMNSSSQKKESDDQINNGQKVEPIRLQFRNIGEFF